MRSTITLNGKPSTEIEGLLIQSLPPISKPLMRTQIEEIEGRDGDIVTNLGFSAYTKQFTIGLYGDFDINEVIAYFNSKGTVTFSNEPDKYYYYEISDQIDFDRLIRFRTATVSMHCQPFKYSATEGAYILEAPAENLLNIPNFTKTTNGITVTVQDGTITLKGTGTAATEFYVPTGGLTLPAGSYTLTALASGRGATSASIRLIKSAPSNPDTFGGNYITLKNAAVTISDTLSASTTYNYLWFYINAGVELNFTLTTTLEDDAEKIASDEGTFLTLDNTAESPFTQLDLKGDTDQTTYSGKNLWALSENKTSSGVTLTNNTDGTFNLTGTATADGIFYVMLPTAQSGITSGQTYSLWSDHALGWGDNSVSCYIQEVREDGSWIGNLAIYQANNSQTIPTITSQYIKFVLVFRANSKFNNYNNVKLQLVKGSTYDTNFEPYVGTPSPNPDYPQEVKVVTGEQTVKIAGKNLINTQSPNVVASTATWTPTETGGIISNTAAWGEGVQWRLNLSTTNTYTFHAEVTPNSTYLYIRTYTDSTFSTVKTRILADATGNVTKTFTPDSQYVAVAILHNSAMNNVPINNLQLEKGSTATDYEPYQSQEYTVSLVNIELCKIGDYQDYIYRDGDDWYVHKETGKYTFTGDEPFGVAGEAGEGYYGYWRSLSTQGLNIAGGTNQASYMTHFKQRAVGSGVKEICYMLSGGEGRVSIIIVVDDITTVNDFKTWLRNNNPLLYHRLATPTNTKITNTALIEQLNTLKDNATAYKGRTHIISTSDGVNLPHIIAAAVTKDSSGDITNAGNTYSKPKLTIYGSGNIGVYLNGLQVFQIALGDEEYITIDTNAMEAYKDTPETLKNRLVDGDYNNFALQAGLNNISFTGAVTKCIVENYSRWI